MKLAKAIRTGAPFRRKGVPLKYMGWLVWPDHRMSAPKGECGGDHPLTALDIMANDWIVKGDV